jgi:hypothetical protein
VRTPRPKPNKLHDELDALLDGRPVELTDELAPLAEAADAFRAELAAFQLDPEVANRHLERVLDGSGTVVQLPLRRQPSGWELRRRVAAIALAAALVLAPATMASAAALPGQAMYPFKLAIEQLRIASVQWSPSREASERTRVADARLDEVQSLTNLKLFNQLPDAIAALEQAVVAANAAVVDAASRGEPVPAVAAKLTRLRAAGGQAVMRVVAEAKAAGGSVSISQDTYRAIQTAAGASQDVLPPPDRTTNQPTPTEATPTPTPKGPDPTAPEPPTAPSQPSDPGTDPTQPSQSTQTTESTSTTQTTEPPTSTTQQPEATSGSLDTGDDQPAPGSLGLEGAAPPTTVPLP